MRILLTGGNGMLGKNLLEHPKAQSYQIFAPRSNELNLLQINQIEDYLRTKQIDLVIHCAGQVGGIHANMANPVGFLNHNLLIGFNLVNAAKQAGVSKLINLGSSCMYPKDYINPLREEYILKAALEPTNEGYALAKIAVAKLCEYMHQQYQLAYKTLIPCNLYGRWDKFADTHSHMIPAVIKKISQAKETQQEVVSIWGSGKARREFMYAADCADGIFFALTYFDKLPDYTNLGLGIDYSINQYYQEIAAVVGFHGKFSHDLTKPTGMQQKLVDTTQMSALGWQAKTSLNEGIRLTYQFYQEHYSKGYNQ